MKGYNATRMRSVVQGAMLAAIGTAGLFVLVQGGCIVTEYCYSNADCPSSQVCNADGICRFECKVDEDCGPSMQCRNNACTPKISQPLTCPEGMVDIAGAFCIDQYEASRPDATKESMGVDRERAVSRRGVMPWRLRAPEDNETAHQACLAAGKDLCTPQQWQAACKGRLETVYGYGNAYQPTTCNGIDTFGNSGFHLLPTGSLPGCQSDWGVFDINGNLWEHTLNGTAKTIRGGAYNCKDSQTLHRCDYVPVSWKPTAQGFRCCWTPTDQTDGGVQDVESVDSSDAAAFDVETGCLDDDATDGLADSEADTFEDAWELGFDGPKPETGPNGCPSDMARIDDFCIDLFEASRIDATSDSQGTQTMASSRKGVMPWFPVDLHTARDGCAAAGKRLCELDEWVGACSGPNQFVYSYGNEYDPSICNGIDTYCDCGGAACGGLSMCPYPHCFNQASSEGGGPCGAAFHAEPTGAFLDCRSHHGLFDINGNVWELVNSDDGLEHFRGGAYNCSNSEALHRCDHDGTWGPSARGFRCCKDPE